MVGAVIVREGRTVGEGWHRKFGAAHAEVNALAAAGERARGATIYVTLEPCCHVGKTPPCTDTLIRAGLARVVTAMADPFPQVAGSGITQLQHAGITVDVGLLEIESRRLNAPFLTLLSKQRPYVHAKWAMSLDGKIATRTGHSQWISGEESRRRVHDLRGRMDAIIVGAGTVRADDPLLTARPPGPRTPVRIVLSNGGDIPENCRVLRTAREVPVLVAGAAIPAAQKQLLESKGCAVLAADLSTLLTELGRRRFTNVVVEGGAGVLGAFRDAALIDEVHAFVAPTLLGGDALSAFAGAGTARVDEGLKLVDMTCAPCGPDWYLNGRVARA